MDAGDAVTLCTDTVRLKGLSLTEPAMASVLEELSSALTDSEVVSALEEPSIGTAHRVLPLSQRTDATANMWTS